MRISRIQITNFRNFESLDVSVGNSAVIVGGNGIGKSNLIFALRLILDPTLPDSARHLRTEDFWDGLKRPLTAEDRIEIRIDFSDFGENPDQLAILGQHLIESDPMVARLTYTFQPLENLEGPPTKDSDYEFIIFGGDRRENEIKYEVRRSLPLEVMPALRDAESDLASWGKSPLRPLLLNAQDEIGVEKLQELADAVSESTQTVAEQRELQNLAESITKNLVEMVGKLFGKVIALGVSSSDSDRLIRSLRVLFDSGKRGIGDVSLGAANVLHLTLTKMGIAHKIEKEARIHTFLAIEEPEAHLHPHIQRKVYRHFLRSRQSSDGDSFPGTILLSTHSPHIVSISPVRSFILLKQSEDGTSTTGFSTANVKLTDSECSDIERYLDVTRGELVFAKGVILVEGEAEQYLIPALASTLGYDLDSLGITVCSVSGTHFDSYLKFIGPSGLDLPFALITDEDPVGENADDAIELRGIARIRRLLSLFSPGEIGDDADEKQVLALAARYGIFMTSHTLEVAMFRSGRHESFNAVMQAISTNTAAKKRSQEWVADPESLEPGRMLKDVSQIGKGRFAQKWASQILAQTNDKKCATSIKDALEHVVGQVTK